MILRSVEWKSPDNRPAGFPFRLPVVQSLDRLDWGSAVTFFVGENGSGKSTVLEAIALAAGSIAVGADELERDDTLKRVRPLADALRLVWTKKTRRGFFLRAVDEDYKDRPGSKSLAALPYNNELDALRRRYGEDGLDANSHGEGFLKLFQSRFTGAGLYLMDEPEAALSPMNQLTLIALIHAMAAQGGQFIIATHSPILLAYPDAGILSFDGDRIHPVAYDTLDHVTVTRDFLADPQRYLARLLGE